EAAAADAPRLDGPLYQQPRVVGNLDVLAGAAVEDADLAVCDEAAPALLELVDASACSCCAIGGASHDDHVGIATHRPEREFRDLTGHRRPRHPMIGRGASEGCNRHRARCGSM